MTLGDLSFSRRAGTPSVELPDAGDGGRLREGLIYREATPAAPDPGR